MTDGQMDLNNVCSWAQGENSSSMCPIEARISSNLHVNSHFITEEAPIYGFFMNSSFVLNRD